MAKTRDIIAELDAINKQLQERKLTSDQHYISAGQRVKNPKARERLREGCQQRDNTYQAKSNARPEVRNKISESQRKHTKTAEHKAKVAESNRAKPKDPAWRQAHKQGLATRDREFHAGEYGVFPSLSAAARYVTEKGLLGNAVKKFEHWKKINPEEYYFINK